MSEIRKLKQKEELYESLESLLRVAIFYPDQLKKGFSLDRIIRQTLKEIDSQ